MLDLSDDAITAWATSAEAGQRPLPAPDPEMVGASDAFGHSLAQLANLLDTSGGTEPARLASGLCDPATLDELRAVLEQAGARPALRVLDWLMTELPTGGAVVMGMVDRSTAGGLNGLLGESRRATLLARLFGIERIRVLEQACRDTLAISEAA